MTLGIKFPVSASGRWMGSPYNILSKALISIQNKKNRNLRNVVISPGVEIDSESFRRFLNSDVYQFTIIC